MANELGKQFEVIPPLLTNFFTPDALAGAGVR
jgi:hypothetical protein